MELFFWIMEMEMETVQKDIVSVSTFLYWFFGFPKLKFVPLYSRIWAKGALRVMK